ncbi:MAG: ABC transporter permease [Gammaproteobacteria bacterium RIFCSPLOWO2_02_FULL_61_13]|nr:MAG: ABC transporter permease [Gammaproteobacteria bacterium RIFCSPLOWO2_02_FULL_61_13]
MNTPVDAMPESAPGPLTPAPPVNPAVRPLYWSVRRELWENRSIPIAPLAVAAITLFGYAISLISLPERRRAVLLLDAAQQKAAIQQPYDLAAMMILSIAVIVGVFYCLDALYGERRDRSILFWKSLPVSDLTTVLSKAAIPLVVLPLLSFAIIVTTQIIMFLLGGAVLLMNDLSAATTWMHLKFFQQTVILLYGLITLALWHAPVYGWLLLVSGWARRAPFLWAVLPLVGVSFLEQMALNSSHFAALLHSRLSGGIGKAFDFDAQGHLDSLAQLTPGNFFSAPGLWFGLAYAAAFLAAAVWLRRDGEPI